MLFCAVWSILILAYLVAAHLVEKLYHALIALVLLAITTIFWFSGSIALAAYIGVPRCDGPFCSTVQSAQAAVAFGFFIWIIFTVLLVFTGLGALKGGARADTSRKPAAPSTVAV